MLAIRAGEGQAPRGDARRPQRPQALVRKAGATFAVAFDPEGTVTTGTFGFITVPESVFLSAKGVVTSVYFGAIPTSKLASGIAALTAGA